MRIWTLTDGKAGDLVQCLGVAEAILAEVGGSLETRTVAPAAAFALFMPRGPVDPFDTKPLAPPYPDVAIASGRRAVAYLRRLKRLSPKTFTLFLKDPRTGLGAADLIWVPEHDRLRGQNVISTLTSPHRLSRAGLEAAAAAARPALMGLAVPRVGVLVGGPSRRVAFAEAEVTMLAERLKAVAAKGAGLMVTPSRRTPASMLARLREALPSGFVWNGSGTNPYVEILALANAFVVTADSVNMVGEAVATGRPVHLFVPAGLPDKAKAFLAGLSRHGAVANFEGRLENLAYEPLNSTPLIAREVLRRLRRDGDH